MVRASADHAPECFAGGVSPPVVLHGLPFTVRVCLHDRRLAPQTRLVLVLLTEKLDPYHFREIVPKDFGFAVGMHADSIGRALRELVEHGYLEMRRPQRKTRLFRLPLSPIPVTPPPAPLPPGQRFDRRRPPEVRIVRVQDAAASKPSDGRTRAEPALE